METASIDLKSKLRQVKDFPKPGINFIDITTVLREPTAYHEAIDRLSKELATLPPYDLIIGPESRGFIFGAPLAYNLGKGFVPIRKRGKLPYKTISVSYQLEYGTDVFEMHEDAVTRGQNVIIVDDLLATGGTTEANIKLVEMLGGKVVAVVFFIELGFLKGRDKLKGYEVRSVLQF